MMGRDNQVSFTVSVNEDTIKEIQKQVILNKLYVENFIYLYGKFNNSRFLT